ncbi:MAG: HAD family phosphatase [Rhodothermales bacterium]
MESQIISRDKRAIVFDIGGVLIDWDPRHLYRRLFGSDEEEMEYFLKHICSQEWNEQMDRGMPFEQAIGERIRQFPAYDPFIRAYFAQWDEMVGGAIEETVRILSRLYASDYYLCALTNWSAETFPIMKRRFSFLSWFEELVVSGEEKVAKPDPAIFHTLLRRIKRRPQQCLFIDDKQANIEVAERMGFRTLLYESPEQLEGGLHLLGLI